MTFIKNVDQVVNFDWTRESIAKDEDNTDQICPLFWLTAALRILRQRSDDCSDVLSPASKPFFTSTRHSKIRRTNSSSVSVCVNEVTSIEVNKAVAIVSYVKDDELKFSTAIGFKGPKTIQTGEF